MWTRTNRTLGVPLSNPILLPTPQAFVVNLCAVYCWGWDGQRTGMLSFHLSRARIQAPVPNFTCKRGFGKQSPSLVYVEQENHWQAAFLPQLQNMAQAQAAGVCGVIQQGFREVCRERASPRSRNADQCHASRPESHPTLPSVKETPLCSEPRVLLCCQTAHKEGRPLALPSVPFPMPQPRALLSQCESPDRGLETHHHSCGLDCPPPLPMPRPRWARPWLPVSALS